MGLPLGVDLDFNSTVYCEPPHGICPEGGDYARIAELSQLDGPLQCR